MFCNVWSPFTEGFKCSLCYSLSCFSHHYHLFLPNGSGRHNAGVNIAMEKYPIQGDVVVSLRAVLHPEGKISPGDILLGLTLQWTSILSRVD